MTRLGWAALVLIGGCVVADAIVVLLPSLRVDPAARYAAARASVVDAQVHDTPSGYVLSGGDSHAELNPSARFCGRDVVDAGISGARAADYATFAARLRLGTPPAAFVLTIGTNDLRKSLRPLASGSVEAFERDAARVVALFADRHIPVVVTAVPPLANSVQKLEAVAVPVYSQRLRLVCERLGCIFADPFGDIREPDGSARESAMRDGVHLASYRAAFANLEKLVCDRLPKP